LLVTSPPPALAPSSWSPLSPAALGGAVATGLSQGALIALVALGYTMVFGVLRLINFAHGEVMMVGAYGGLFGIRLGGARSPIVAAAAGIAAAIAAAVATGLLVERVAYRPLRRKAGAASGSRRMRGMGPLVAALGASVFLQNAAQLCFGADFRPYPRLFAHTRAGITAAAVLAMVALELVVRRTWLGLCMRAVAADPEAARLMGIDPDRVVAATFALGSALAGVGAVLLCLDQSPAFPTMGIAWGTRAFVAAVLGGIGSIPGAVAGGLLLGVLGELAKLTSFSGEIDVLVFLVLVFVLVARPRGLLGEPMADRP
jgi:branched-chain amino acid transport system permease protein